MRSGTYLLPSKKASQLPFITEAATRGTSGIREEVKPMTKQPGIQQVGILLAPTVVFIHFHDTFFSPGGPIPGWQRMTMMKYLWDKATAQID